VRTSRAELDGQTGGTGPPRSKTQAGIYLYEEGNRQPVSDPEVDRLIEQFREEQGIQAREIPDREILERCMYVMINEAAKILEEGIAARALDVDVTWIYGYGFPLLPGWAHVLGRSGRGRRDP